MPSEAKNNKQNIIIRFLNFIVDTFASSLKKALSTIFGAAFFIFISYLIKINYSVLRNFIQIPIYQLLVLALFALCGLLLMIKNYFLPLFRKKAILIRIRYSRIDVEWRSKHYYDGSTWRFSEPTIYCTKHNLKMVTTVISNFQGANLMALCTDCANEGIKLSKKFDTPPGSFILCPNQFYDEFMADLYNHFEKALNEPGNRTQVNYE